MILLSIGSNQGDRLALLAQAAGLLAEKGIKILGASAVYETDPFGFLEQPPFLNAVLEVETTEAPEQLLASCLAVETALGRKRLVRWGPRTLDLDILYISGVHCSDEYLKLPHPGLFQRAFVLVPLWELLKERLPEDLAMVPERLAELQADVQGVRWYAPFPLPQTRTE
nr:2-amino-4-hydroxy-6-hydroxymethyldihydropteridine diphosphokinase [uncultured Anaeromusa sp.]